MAVVEHVEAAIGMNDSIGDEAACIRGQFYSAIGFGLSLEKAFNQGKAALMLEGNRRRFYAKVIYKGWVRGKGHNNS